MMEGMNQTGQEEYIWAMRTSAYRGSDSDLWKHRRSTPRFSQSQQLKKEKSVAALEDHQTKVMASLVPDEVIYNVNDYDHRNYDACFLFGDVSGFTELCEKYNKTGVSGPSRMTQVLNKYLGAMVQEILSHNGDILKFSGDAFLAMFKSSENETMRDSVHEALDCALVIQKSYGQYETDVGVIIRVKLAISAGHVMFALIGDEKNSHYVVVGKPIWDVKAAESISTAGDIIVSPAAWHYVNTNEYLAQDMDDGVHIKLLGVGPNWRSVQKNVRQQKLQRNPSDELSQDDDSLDSQSNISIAPEVTNDEFSLRPAVNAAARLNIKEDLRKFIIAPVMKSIDMDEPFEYLTEMRQSVIMFINVISEKIEAKETVILADQTYRIVCSVVDQMKGCVNKVSLFDKDLMFVVIFGLRGLKNELECQIALRCATECHQAINNLSKVKSTSIGVTTGKCYCGVFGHTLRREYTVISLTVNKAARIMVAYKNKVTCDRETFLHSKMEARNFILQEPKPLKGISHPGPVYEFKEVEISHDIVHKINPFPLLGRDGKLKLYLKLLEDFLNADDREQQYKMIIIQGVARQGKTRLLDELVYRTPSELPINRVTLTIRDSKIPFQAMKLFFAIPLSVSTDSTSKEREGKFLLMLRKIQVPDLLCVLNSIFSVNFPTSQLYLSLTEEERKIAQRKMIKQLCYACFVNTWLIAIDGAEFIDDHSWTLLDILLEVHTIFILATLGRDKMKFTENVNMLLSDTRVKSVLLNPIDKWYHGALACQILDVYAIPPELEKVIQSRSNGNPGWIESFLISLIQDDGLYVLQADLRQINDLGLMCPPLYMMKRMGRDETLNWKQVMEERRPSMDSIAEGDYWKKYIETCRESYLNVTIREQMESKAKRGVVKVCVISPNFNVADVEAELSIDVMIMKTFDSLNSYEQLLIKCSAILGNQFPRDMLLYVMSATAPRRAALAVQKLFEIKVLTCAKGDFLEGGNMVFKERLLNPNDDAGLKCQCKGLKIDESCMDLPRYASCGYMQFRSSMFRDITYNLLTDNQKKEFHYRAIRYLEKETRRCRACGNGFFDRILGTKHETEFLTDRQRKKRTASSSSSWEEVSLSHRTSIYSSGTVSINTTRKSQQQSKFDRQSIVSSRSALLIDVPKSTTKNYSAIFGVTLINKLKNSFSLTRAFSSEDFTDCQCNLILNTTYAQLVEHCSGAGDLNKLVYAMMEYSYVCIISCNIPLAMRVLDEALQTLNELMKENTENAWKLSLIKAKIFTLVGYSRIELGQLDEALRNLQQSLSEYGLTFPHGKISKQLKTCGLEFKQTFGMYVFPSSLIKNLDHWETVFSNNLAECLSHYCTICMAKDEWKDAELAASWSLSKALEAFTDFQVICTAYANMIFVAQHFQKWKMCIALEVHALRICHLKKIRVEAEELKAVSRLYGVIFCSRVFRADMEKSIHIGYIVLRLCSSVHASKIVLPLLPLLMQCLIIGKHTSNVISLLQELDYFADEDSDNSGKVWYYALCICFHLETGYCVIPYNVCERFFQVEGENWITIRDPDARRRYFTVMWLWCIRNEKWEAASLWCTKTKDFLVITESDTISNKFTALYLLEGLILYLVCKMDRRNIHGIIQAEHEIEQLLGVLEKSARSSKVILPRLFHLKAYYRFVKYNDSKVGDLLNNAKLLAEKHGNALESSWIDHTFKAWLGNLTTSAENFWKDHSETDVVDIQDIESTRDVGYFTLPVPLYHV